MAAYRRQLGDMVPGAGPAPSDYMIVGEAPGEEEDRQGMAFVGKSGQVLWQLLWKELQLTREDCYVTNLYKIRPPENRDPTEEEIQSMSAILVEEIREVQPKVVLAMGRFSARFLTGRQDDMAVLNGKWLKGTHGPHWVVPVAHPAAGLHQPDMLTGTLLGLRSAAYGPGVVGGQSGVVPKVALLKPRLLDWDSLDWDRIGYDTEGSEDEPYSLQVSSPDGKLAFVIMADDRATLQEFADWLQRRKPLVVMHHSLHDIRVSRKFPVPILFREWQIPVHDTMLDAYHLQSEPKGLKPLATRHLDLPMRDYLDVVEGPCELARQLWAQAAIDRLRRETLGHGVLEQRLSVKGKPLKPKWIDCHCPPCEGYSLFDKALRKIPKGERVNWKLLWEKLDQETREMIGALPEPHLKHVPIEDFLKYAGLDPSATVQTYNTLAPKIVDMQLDRVSKLDHRVLPMIGAMVDRGLPVNRAKLQSLRSRLQVRATALKLELIEEARALGCSPDWNPDSGDDVEQLLLLAKIQLKKLTKGKTRFSTDDSVLEEFKGVPIVDMVRDYREATKLDRTYGAGIEAQTDSTNRLHPDLRTTSVYSGRLSGFLLTFPRPDREDGILLRDVFEAPPGFVLYSADLSQIEPRKLAHLSQDPAFIAAFMGDDFYTATAAETLGVPTSEIRRKVERQIFKMVVLAAMYGVTPEGLVEQIVAQGIPITVERVRELLAKFKARFPGIAKYRDQVLAQTRRDGFVRGVSGRIRWLPAIYFQGSGWPFSSMREEAERQAFNFVIQEGAQYVERLLMAKLWEEYLTQLPPGVVYPLLQIHDDLLFEVHEDWVGVLDQMFQQALSEVAAEIEFSVPLLAEAKVGRGWGSMRGIGGAE